MAGRSYTPATLCAHLRACGEASLAEAGDSTIGGVSQHAPDHGAFPAASLTRRNTFAIEPPRDLRDAKSLDGIHLKDAPHHAGLGFIDQVGSERLFRLAGITVAIRSAAHYAHLPRVCTVSLATTRTLQDLGSFVLRNHALELNQELIFRTVALRRLHEQGFDARGGRTLRSAKSGKHTFGSIGRASMPAQLGSVLRRRDRAHVPNPGAPAWLRYSLHLRRPTLWAPPAGGSGRTRSATPSGWRSCSPRVAAPTKPVRR